MTIFWRLSASPPRCRQLQGVSEGRRCVVDAAAIAALQEHPTQNVSFVKVYDVSS